jgi:hypothetical protein
MIQHIITLDTSELEDDRSTLESELETLIESIPDPEDEGYVEAVEALAEWLGVTEINHIEFFGKTPWSSDMEDLLNNWALDGEGLRLKELNDLKAEISEWRSGVTLIREDTFEAYAQQHAEDCGEKTDGWPYDHIDWSEAADSLEKDYREVSYDSDTWLYRE